MTNNSTKATTANLVKDYTNYKLRQFGYDSESYSGLEAPTTVHRVFREMGDKYETAFFRTFSDMTSQINIHGNDLEDVIFAIYDQTVANGEEISWGRIIGIFLFSARLSVVAQGANRPDVVSKLIQWTTEYLEQDKFNSWISQQGGWNGFLQFYKSPQHTNGNLIDGVHFTWNKAYYLGLNVMNSAANMLNTIMG